MNEKKSLKTGTMIVLEGNEAAGKTTQAKRLVEYFRNEMNIDAVYIREPGGNEVAEKLREIILNNELDPTAELFLFNAVRRINLVENVVPALKDGKLVIMDRFIDSTYVYQGFINNSSLSDINTLHKICTNDCMLFQYRTQRILIDVDLKETMRRLSNRGEGNKYDKLDENFLRRVGTAYRIRFDSEEDDFKQIKLDFLKEQPPVVTIDGNGTMDEVFEILKNHITELLNYMQVLR